MKKLIVCLIVFVGLACSICAQNKTIKGRVIDNHLDPLAFVSIVINDSLEVGRTYLNGGYEVNVPEQVKKIQFRCLGMEPTIIELADSCTEAEVIMMAHATYDFKTGRMADRFRRKEFKKLPLLHKEAFAKGIFKTARACYAATQIGYRKKNK